MWGCKGDYGSSGVLLATILALAGTATLTLLALLGGYLIALGLVALILFTPVVLAELELYERAAGSAPEVPADGRTAVPEAPPHPPQPAGEAQVRRVA